MEEPAHSFKGRFNVDYAQKVHNSRQGTQVRVHPNLNSQGRSFETSQLSKLTRGKNCMYLRKRCKRCTTYLVGVALNRNSESTSQAQIGDLKDVVRLVHKQILGLQVSVGGQKP
eukprot:1985326-Pyramimonas_sp.AAC.1